MDKGVVLSPPDKVLTPQAQVYKQLNGHLQSSAALKRMVFEALEEVGGVDYLVEMAKEKPNLFLPLLTKMLPKAPEVKEIDASSPDGNFNIEITWEAPKD